MHTTEEQFNAQQISINRDFDFALEWSLAESQNKQDDFLIRFKEQDGKQECPEATRYFIKKYLLKKGYSSSYILEEIGA